MAAICPTDTAQLTALIKAEAQRLGFDACGVAPAQPVSAEVRESLHRWLENGCQADMHYMAQHADLRTDPRQLMEGAESIICVALNYYPPLRLQREQYQFAWYAYGKDYHDLVKEKLRQLLAYIRNLRPDSNGRVCCDTAPILERYWAAQAGLGWIGKNNMLIIPHAGSTFFLGELLVDIPLVYDRPHSNRCGRCTRCLEACPTQALRRPYQLDATRCLSYLTIEHRGEIPAESARRMGGYVYGCDRCQLACPYNRFARPTHEAALMPSEAFLHMTPDAWDALSVEEYRTLFKGSAVKRAKYEGLMRNIRSMKENSPKKEE